MVVFKERGYEFAINLIQIRYIIKHEKRITIFFKDGNYKNIDCESEYTAGNIFDGIINAKASSNEVYKIIW